MEFTVIECPFVEWLIVASKAHVLAILYFTLLSFLLQNEYRERMVSMVCPTFLPLQFRCLGQILWIPTNWWAK